MSDKRPKSSLVGLGDLGLSVLNTSRIRSLTSEIGSLGSGVDALESNIRQLNKRLSSESEKYRSHMYEQNRTIMEHKEQVTAGMADLHKRIDRFSWEFSNFGNKINSHLSGIENSLHRIENHAEQPGLLRLLIKNTEDELQKIEQISEDFLEFAALMAENLVVLANREENQIYKYLSGEDLRWAKGVLESVHELDGKLQKLLRE